MRLLDGRLDWTNLYRIYEVISEAVGGDDVIIARGWATKAQLGTFTLSANHPAVSGDESRHGTMRGQPSQRMELQHAVALVKRLARDYIMACADTKA